MSMPLQRVYRSPYRSFGVSRRSCSTASWSWFVWWFCNFMVVL